MERHVTAEELQRFAQHESSAVEVRSVARHLETCEGCRAAAPLPQEHLDFEQLAALAEGTSDEGSDHAAMCVVCHRELNDLRQFQATRVPRRQRWLFPAAAALLIAVAGGGFAFKTIQTQRAEARLVNVTLPADVLAMKSRRLTFRGGAGAPQFDVVEPRNSVVMMDKPRFRWNAPDGATSVVEVFAPDFTRVVVSPPLKTTSWTSPVALRRGVAYRWQVTVGSMTIPAPPLAEALFIVVPANEAVAIGDLEKSTRRPSLELAAAYAHAGDFDRARAELRALINDGRQTRAATTLLGRIDSVVR